MSERVHVPGGREVVATLDSAAADRVVVACPPHPQYGGSRSDQRLRAVSDALGPDVACLRFDYGPWDEGRGERVDAENALAWATDRYEAVGLFGYSFGAGVAVRAAAEGGEAAPGALSVLAPPATSGGASAADALDAVDCPVQVVYGERDDTVDWRPVVERARERDHDVESVAADHHFVGQADKVADVVATFLSAHL
ncbi:dienelactone hydrolase family protein [Halomicroarcula sp. F13]|uniref:Dienelactone hydrolase family protein n=1 Tax=Haloarcula rubra TaxID=2487747 RepID=A0AAW4PT46_9EURY|nr:dienelactone hydrolase family protein [Halomicroarcula rubra]MBX0323730.1 dienelactone hydrolase family protein [Halomicroarcula rubra]